MENLSRIAEAGILGALLAVAIGAIVVLYRQMCKLYELRIADIKDMLIEDLKFRQELKKMIQNILNILRNEHA